MKLFEFAYCPSFERKISNLTTICPEKWSFGANNDNVILKNYIEQTFRKTVDEDKIICSDHYAVFNTGLFTSFYEPIFAYFLENEIPDKQKWFFDGFYTEYQLAMFGVKDLPKRANYFSKPSDMVFDTNCDTICNLIIVWVWRNM